MIFVARLPYEDDLSAVQEPRTVAGMQRARPVLRPERAGATDEGRRDRGRRQYLCELS